MLAFCGTPPYAVFNPTVVSLPLTGPGQQRAGPDDAGTGRVWGWPDIGVPQVIHF